MCVMSERGASNPSEVEVGKVKYWIDRRKLHNIKHLKAFIGH